MISNCYFHEECLCEFTSSRSRLWNTWQWHLSVFVWHRKVCKCDAIGSSTTAKNVVVLVSQELFTTVSHICYTRRTLVERQLNMNLHATLLMHQYTFIQLVEGEVLLRALTWSEPHSLHFLGLQLALLYQPRDHGAAEAPVRLQLAQVIHLKQALTRGDLRHHFAMSQCYSGTMVSSFILWGRQLPSLRELGLMLVVEQALLQHNKLMRLKWYHAHNTTPTNCSTSSLPSILYYRLLASLHSW